jgi:hypothetical protein
VAKSSRRERDRMRTAELAGSAAAAGGGRRERRTSYRRRGFFDRFGGLILLGFAALGLVALGFVFLQSSTQRAYACDSLMTPGPTDPMPTPTAAPTATPSASPTPTSSPTTAPSATPAATSTPTASPTAAPTATPGPTPTPGPTTAPTPTPAPTPSPSPVPAPTQRLGFVTADLGRDHITDKTKKVEYAYCPPGSGPHWNIANVAPVPRAFYGPEQSIAPEQWIHDLEHGFVVQLYSCGADGKSCPSTDEMAKLKQVFDETPVTPGAITCSVPNQVLVIRFDDMATRFAIVAWDRTLMSDTIDVQQSITFAEQWSDGPAAPELGACF